MCMTNIRYLTCCMGNERRVCGDGLCQLEGSDLPTRRLRRKDFTNKRSRFAGIIDEAVHSKNRKQVTHPFTGGACLLRVNQGL